MKPQVKKALYFGIAMLVPAPVLGLLYMNSLSDFQYMMEIYGSLLLFVVALVAVMILITLLGDKFLRSIREIYLSFLSPEKREICRLKLVWEDADKILNKKQEAWISFSEKSGKVDDPEKMKSPIYEEYRLALDSSEKARTEYFRAVRALVKRSHLIDSLGSAPHEEYCKAVIAEIGRQRERHNKMWGRY